MWHELLRSGQRITDLAKVAPGDVVFLTCDATPYLAYSVDRIVRHDNITELWMNGHHKYVIGSQSSTVTFETAIRPAHHHNPKEDPHED